MVNPDYVNKYVCKNVKNKSVLFTLCCFTLYESKFFTDFARAVNINVFVVLSKSKKEMSYFTKLTSLLKKIYEYINVQKIFNPILNYHAQRVTVVLYQHSIHYS